MTHVTWLVVVLLVSGVLLDAVSSSTCTGGDVNGCTIPFKLPYKSHFEPACNRHDVCYGCGSKFGKSRRTCDREFKSNMKNLCTSSKCRRWASTYYTAVRIFGFIFYKDKSLSWCNQPWISGCV